MYVYFSKEQRWRLGIWRDGRLCFTRRTQAIKTWWNSFWSREPILMLCKYTRLCFTRRTQAIKTWWNSFWSRGPILMLCKYTPLCFTRRTVPLPANFNYPLVLRGLPTSVHSDVLHGHLYLYRCPCWLRNQPATWPWRRGGHLCQVASGDYIITLRNTASFAQLPVYPICWTSVNKISCWTRLLTSFNCEYGVEWMVDL